MTGHVPTPEDLESERGFQRWVVEFAQWYHWRAYHPWLSVHSADGWPDLALVREGRLVFAECKSMRGKLTPAQDGWLRALARVPGVETYLWRPRDRPQIERVLL